MIGAIYALIALGYTMVYGVLKLINFAHGEVFMLGTFCALFASWMMGYDPRSSAATATNPTTLIVMLVFSMVVCGVVGVAIERLAYRPMRNKPRIASLITAIGVSLLLQYGGALFLPVSPPQSVQEKVNPYGGNLTMQLKPRDASLVQKSDEAKALIETTKAALDAQIKKEGVTSEFDLTSSEGQALRTQVGDAERSYNKLKSASDASGIDVTVSYGRLIMFFTTMFLMLALRHLVMKTPVGRQMRAVSNDFDSAALMGIDVNKVVTVTFLIGSSLAGAGGMMAATFQGIALTTFSGVEYGVKAFVAAVLGGIGNIPGAVLGGLLMGLAEAIVTALGFSVYKDIIAFVILIFVLLVRPGGLLGSAKVEKV